jgi:glutamate synthase (NADPH/NADH) small chain
MRPVSGITPGRLSPEETAHNFSDIEPAFARNDARVASERCLFCYDAPCVVACPTSIDIPLFIRQIATGNPQGAAKTIFDSNILGGMCARVCPTETLCEQACVRELAEGKPIEIGRLQRYATDVLLDAGTQPYSRKAATGKRVAVIGAGPAGLSCAHALSREGHEVTIFEARPKSGGLNEYGIAAYKTTNNFAQREVDFILELGGITVKNGMALGKDVKLDQLRQDFDAVFIGAGLAAVNGLNLAGEDLQGVADAVDWIASLRQASDMTQLPVGRRVVVIGGGMTAIDAASQVKRLGAEEVTIVYRRGPEQMNASRYEQELAQTDGVLIRHWLSPKRLIGEAGRITGVEFDYMEEKAGKLSPTGETLILPCDQLFKAIGQKLVAPPVEALALEAGRIRVDDARHTSLNNVWAGGDCIAGGRDLTVSAVEDGKVAARSIHAYLSNA